MLIAVNYHYVRPVFEDPYPSIFGVKPDQLKRQLEMLGSAGTFVSADQIRGAIEGSANLPSRAILVTFDDGLREQYENARPVLRQLGVPAIYFVNTSPIASSTVSSVHKIHILRSCVEPNEFIEMLRRRAAATNAELRMGADPNISRQYPYDTPSIARLKYALNFLLRPNERDALIGGCFEEAFDGEESEISRCLYLDRDQIRSIADQGELGTHAHEHVPLAQLPYESVAAQIDSSLRHLEEWSGMRPYAMSYPYGSGYACSDAVGQIAGALGIRFALTMERAANEDLSRPLMLARFDSNDLPGGSSPKCDLDSLFTQVAEKPHFLPEISRRKDALSPSDGQQP